MSVEQFPVRRSQFVSECCQGEKCYCGRPAEHKVEETIFPDDPMPERHPYTAYICDLHFAMVMGLPPRRP